MTDHSIRLTFKNDKAALITSRCGTTYVDKIVIEKETIRDPDVIWIAESIDTELFSIRTQICKILPYTKII